MPLWVFFFLYFSSSNKFLLCYMKDERISVWTWSVFTDGINVSDKYKEFNHKRKFSSGIRDTTKMREENKNREEWIWQRMEMTNSYSCVYTIVWISGSNKGGKKNKTIEREKEPIHPPEHMLIFQLFHKYLQKIHLWTPTETIDWSIDCGSVSPMWFELFFFFWNSFFIIYVSYLWLCGLHQLYACSRRLYMLPFFSFCFFVLFGAFQYDE